jgi:hypothetical protein
MNTGDCSSWFHPLPRRQPIPAVLLPVLPNGWGLARRAPCGFFTAAPPGSEAASALRGLGHELGSMGKGGLVQYDNTALLGIIFRIDGSIFDNILPKVRAPTHPTKRPAQPGATAVSCPLRWQHQRCAGQGAAGADFALLLRAADHTGARMAPRR